MKVLFDACVVMDIFGKSSYIFDSFCSYDVALARGFTPCLSVSSVADICRLLHTSGSASEKRAAELTAKCLELFDLVENTGQDCIRACNSPMGDYEDALVAASAYRAGVDLIITRNVRGFKNSSVATMTPAQFVETFKPDSITYAELDFEDENQVQS